MIFPLHTSIIISWNKQYAIGVSISYQKVGGVVITLTLLWLKYICDTIHFQLAAQIWPLANIVQSAIVWCISVYLECRLEKFVAAKWHEMRCSRLAWLACSCLAANLGFLNWKNYSSSFLGPKMASEAISQHLISNFFSGEGGCPQTPLAVACLCTCTTLLTPNLSTVFLYTH